MELPLDYATLRVIWWGLLGVLLIGFALTDGYDLGVASLLPFVARNDAERRMTIETISSMWEGHQVWLILGGGAIFAAWPFVYAISFSGFYLAMFVVLAALILRPVGFKYRSKRESAAWRRNWDWALFTGGFVPALIFGVAVGNVLRGVPFDLDPSLRATYEGGLIGLLNPFALLTGLISVCMLTMHGAAWLVVKAEKGMVRDRAARYGMVAALVAVALFILAGVWTATILPGYTIVSEVVMHGPSNPLRKTVAVEAGAWLANFSRHPWMVLAPVMAVAGGFAAAIGLGKRRNVLSLAGSSVSVFGVVATAGVSMFPFILPSSLNPDASLTVWDSSSSAGTLFFMLIMTAIFVPLIALYTAWVFKVLWGRVATDTTSSSGPY